MKKEHHSFHECSNPEDLIQRLRSRGIDLLSVVLEFVRPREEIGVLVVGSFADGIATKASDLDVLILVDDLSVLKQPRTRLWGILINNLPAEEQNERRVSFVFEGLEIDLQFLANGFVSSGRAQSSDRGVIPDIRKLSTQTFLSRLLSGWVVHNPAYVGKWRNYHAVDKFRLRRMISQFMIAARTLEDMEAAIDHTTRDLGVVGSLGIYIVSHLMKSMLALDGYCGDSSKWLRKVCRLIERGEGETCEAYIEGRALMFPAFLKNAGEERIYFESVRAFAEKVRLILARAAGVGDALDYLIHDVNVALREG